MTTKSTAVLLFLSFVFFCREAVAQVAPERSTPFTAVKWLQDNPYVRVDNEWETKQLQEKSARYMIM